MIILDTNVISETMRRAPDPQVLTYLDGLERGVVHVTAVTVAELMFGAAAHRDATRRQALSQQIEDVLDIMFSGRILPFDTGAARIYGVEMGARRRAGAAISAADGQIAAIGVQNNATVVTRDVSPFQAFGAKTLNPWGSQ